MIRMHADTSELNAFLGSSDGFLDTIKTPVFINDLVNYAHAEVAPKFDRDAAVYAAATHNINHVYEWGAAGINDAPGTTALDPTSPVARLWTHHLGGRGSGRSISYEFRASQVPVPLPNPDSTGVDAEYLQSHGPKRRHVFYWKAPIMELGIAVTIKPKYAKALFIPLGGVDNGDDYDANRGYTMTSKPIRTVPGKKFRGQFSIFWEGWWSQQGAQDILDVANRVATEDSMVIADSSVEARRYAKGATKKTVALSISASSKKAKAQLAMHARRRAARAKAFHIREKVVRGFKA